MRETARPITLTIAALGGQGGGVVQEWMVAIARKSGYRVQATSVPGVAQRTGATIYYLEFYPADTPQDPVMALMPVAENCDLVIASELVEAARMVQRGFVSPELTTLVTSSHRNYTIDEKSHLADGRADSLELMELVSDSAQKLIMFDMEAVAEAHNSVISAAMLGGICAADVLPFPSEFYESAIRESGRGVDASLAAFFGARDAVRNPELESEAFVEPLNPETSKLPDPVARIVGEALPRLRDYQDNRYAQEYLDMLQPFLAYDNNHYALAVEVARGLAVWMTFEDTIRIASLKTHPDRLLKLLQQESELTHVVEYMKPRIAEITGTLPAPVGRWLQSSKLAHAILRPLTRGLTLRSSGLPGYTLLRLVAGLRIIRRTTLRFRQELAEIKNWLELIQKLAKTNEELALEIARCQELVTGYGETRERGQSNFNQITLQVDVLLTRPDAAGVVRLLRTAAQQEETGQELAAAMSEQGLVITHG